MKHIMKPTALVLLCALLLCLVACGQTVDTDALWRSATYDSYTVLGEGEHTVTVTICVGEHSAPLVIKTDKDNLGEAMYELGLVNDPVFFDTCNGMRADYDSDHAYWEFRVNGSIALYGIGDAPVPSTDDYQLGFVQ